MISQTRNTVLALLLLAAVAQVPETADAAPAGTPAAGAALGKPPPGAMAPSAAHSAASVPAKPGAANADDDNDPDFPPLKPGESFHLLSFTIIGSKHIDQDALIATLPEHVGDPIDDAKIQVDTDKIRKALHALHVHGELTPVLMQREGRDHGLRVEWVIQHNDPLGRTGDPRPWKFGGQTFSGNRALTRAQLEKAVDLKAGGPIGDGAVSDARTGMEQAYDKVFPGKQVKIVGKLKLTLKPERVANFEWQITEPPAK